MLEFGFENEIGKKLEIGKKSPFLIPGPKACSARSSPFWPGTLLSPAGLFSPQSSRPFLSPVV